MHVFLSSWGICREKLFALYTAEQGGAQVLMGLLALQYGLKLFPFGCPHFKKISNIVRDTSSQIVFVALEGKKMNLTMKWQEVFAVLAH